MTRKIQNSSPVCNRWPVFIGVCESSRGKFHMINHMVWFSCKIVFFICNSFCWHFYLLCSEVQNMSLNTQAGLKSLNDYFQMLLFLFCSSFLVTNRGKCLKAKQHNHENKLPTNIINGPRQNTTWCFIKEVAILHHYFHKICQNKIAS